MQMIKKFQGLAGYIGKIRWHPHRGYAVIFAIAFVICIFNITKKSEFLYFQF